MSFSVPLTSFFKDVKIGVTSYFMYGVSHEGKYCTQLNISEKSSNISRKLLSLLVGVTKVFLCDVYFITLNDIDLIIYAN